MDGEMGAAARIALVLIVICIIIAIVFTVITFARGAANEGTATMQQSMESMQDSLFDDYDQTKVSGSQVSSAIKLYEGRPIAVVVATKAGSVVNYNALVNGADPTAGTIAMGVDAGKTKITVETLQPGVDADYLFFHDYAKTRNSADKAFIRASAQFKSYLIKDAGDQTVGVFFKQQ